MIALPLALGGCAGVLVVGGLAGAAGGGYAAAQERGVDGAFNDWEVQNDIQKGLMKAQQGLEEGITTTVYQGRVLLTGRVATPEMKMAAEQVAGRSPGVRALYDEIEVAPPSSTWDSTKDAWITARLRSELMLDGDVRSGNYTIDTTNGSVYLIGSARSPGELERATRIARYLPGVKRVVSYVELRSGAPVAAQPASPVPPPGRAGPGNPSAAPQAPIEVQKL
ncbi:MAG TPA: BON domain-containing protein [Stellaceae bacterium]|nr:BON domain-containing protein [Stellaceae bacterium]